MAGINVVASKDALLTLITAQTGTGGLIEGVVASYSYVAKLHEKTRELVCYADRTAGTLAVAAMRGGSGASDRVKRREDSTTQLQIRVTKLGQQTTQAGETRAAAIGAVIENIVANNYNLSAVTGLLKAVFNGYEMTSYADEDGTYTTLSYSISFDSMLT